MFTKAGLRLGKSGSAAGVGALNVPSGATAGTGAAEQERPIGAAAPAAEQAVVAPSQTFEEIFRQYQHPIYNYILRLMGNPEEAYDLTQDVFVKAFRAIDRTTPDLNVSAWLYRIATNACLDQLRRRRIIRWQPLDTFISVFHPSQVARENPERETIRKETAELVQQTLDRLNPKYRTCLVLREYQDLSCEEIAEILGTTRGAVKSLLFRAREEFRKIYASMGGEAP